MGVSTLRSKNKPGRDTCRACGKSPDEAVAAPWFKNPAVLGGIAAVVIIVVVILQFFGGPSWTIDTQPGAETMYREGPRFGEPLTATQAVDGGSMTIRGQLKAHGRVVAVEDTFIVIGFGDRLANDKTFQRAKFRNGQAYVETTTGKKDSMPFIILVHVGESISARKR